MPPPKPRTLKINPVQSCDVGFNMSGVIDQQNGNWKLGDRIGRFPLDTLYADLETPLHSGRLQYDAASIDRYLRTDHNQWMFSIRAQSVIANLERMIVQRQIAFLQTYKHRAEIAQKYAALYPSPVNDTSKLGRLQALVRRTDERHRNLSDEYTRVGRTGVVTQGGSTSAGSTESTTSSSSHSETDVTSSNRSSGTSRAATNGTGKSLSQEAGTSEGAVHTLPLGTDSKGDSGESTYVEIPMRWTPDNGGEYQQIEGFSNPELPTQRNTGSMATTVQTNGTTNSESESSSDSNSSSSSASTSNLTATALGEARTSTSTRVDLTEFLHPSAENDIRMQRRQLDLQDELISHELLAMRVPHLEMILGNELRLLDLEIKQQQLNYIHSFLLPPIGGQITGVYKDLGEHVEAGEPVVRIENDAEVFVVGWINYRSRLDVGTDIRVTTTNAFESETRLSLEGQVVSVRGHDADNDEWNVILRCDNLDETDTNPDVDLRRRKFPLHYSFDHRDVTLEIL